MNETQPQPITEQELKSIFDNTIVILDNKIKTTTNALYVVLGFALVSIILSIIIWFRF